MTNRWFLLSALTVILIMFAIGWLVLSSRVAYFTLERRLRIEVDGVPVEGEILGNRFSAIVTRRDAGKKHSYQLFYEGDVDFTGDMGSVSDCHQWVALRDSFSFGGKELPRPPLQQRRSRRGDGETSET
jgi:hypothetical protein